METFWSSYGPLLAGQLQKITELEKEVQHWKTAYELAKQPDALPLPEPVKKRPAEPAKPKSYAKRIKPTEPQPIVITTHVLKAAQPTRNAKICGSCKSTSSPQWRANNGDRAWGDRICNACHIREKRKK